MRVLAVVSFLVCLSPPSVPAQPCPEEFQYKGRAFLIDCYPELFGPTLLGQSRKQLFKRYLQESPEGRLRASRANAGSPERAWTNLTREEQTSFLAITAALANLRDESGAGLSDWSKGLDEIHGENSFSSGRRFGNDEAFRVYVRLTDHAVKHLLADRGVFANLCRSGSFG
ncbi:MAG: hypothetical protein HY238_08400 [Acidobacteria bacterium]|nr:hypothetical protein [Acidobacteriota bacterium]